MASKIRKLKPAEILLEVAQSESQSTISCYWLLLESKNKISEEQIEETLRILFRNIDILHLCIQKENGDYWFYKMAEEKIPLKILKNQSLFDVFSNETHTSFVSATGPLWRANYFPNSETEKERDIFISNIMFTFNHAIVDGYTAFIICNSFLKTLNDVIGDNVKSSYDFGKLNDGHEAEEQAVQRMEYLKKNPEYFDEVKSFFAKYDNQKLMLKDFFPISKNVEKKTKYIHGEINKETTKKLLNVFKSKGISFHAGFSSVLNWVLMEIFSENGLTDEAIDLPTEHAINLRKYWKTSASIQLGTQIVVMKMLSKTDKNVGENFWDYAKEFNKTLKSAIENMHGIDCNIYLATSNFGRSRLVTNLLEKYPHDKSYYCATNMGDLSSIVQGRGDHVNIKWLTRGASGHGMNFVLVPYFQTYEGRLLYCISYSTHIVRDDFANLFVSKLINKLKIISNLK